ncbi:unnamed protein product [Prorocentrum cordatum]|uniref:VWFD domain-containing protein n=1 Tax=Prorocentrum cordatum TaxID=2364126 RepID=A0ABN9XJ51_9DINO|nr:unnamed protein product [Polarella glacialis]
MYSPVASGPMMSARGPMMSARGPMMSARGPMMSARGFPGGGFGGGGAEAGCGPSACACGRGCGGGCSCGGGGVGGWTYGVVPEGTGEYVACTTYRYVGMGAGNVALFPVPAVGSGCSCWWSLCLLWLLLPLLWLLLWPLFDATTTTSTSTTTSPEVSTSSPPPDTAQPTSMPTPAPTSVSTPPPTATPAPPIVLPTPAPPPTAVGLCRVFGDPHVTTFDGSHVSFYSQGEYWLVKSQTVWIQARYLPTPVTNGLSVVKEVAVGGPFLDSADGRKNILRISALKASFNGQPIIPDFPDRWQSGDPMIQVVTDSSGETLQPGRGGKEMHVVHVKLPGRVSLQINRWNEPGEGDYINVQITTPKQPGQDGHCGNFNGNPADDTRPLIRSRIGTTGVDAANLLFEVKTPVVKPNRPDLNNCPTEKTDHAREVCLRQSSNGMASHDCMVDVCFGGDQFAELGGYDSDE